MIIEKAEVLGYRTGILKNITKEDIVNVLGFEPNIEDDIDKVENSWGVKVDDITCAIWDYKGSHRFLQWSTFGNDLVFMKLFGSKYISEQ